MKNIIIDTNGYAAFKNGNEDAIEIIRIAEQIGICTIVLGELLAGFIIGSKEEKNRKELSDFLNSPRVTILMADNETAEYYARIFSQLKQKGQPIPTNDLWIGAIAMQHGYSVFTYDKHFSISTTCSFVNLLPSYYREPFPFCSSKYKIWGYNTVLKKLYCVPRYHNELNLKFVPHRLLLAGVT